jgi:hypothetical protein
MNELDRMNQALTNLVTAFNSKTSGSQTPNAALAAARASAQAASASAATASTQAGNATNSAQAASTSKTNASNSATAAATSATNAANSATAAAGSVTAAGNSASAAATSATNAGNSNTAAQGYNNRVQTLQQVSPVATGGPTTTGAASTTWNCNASFTAPCNGWVFAIGSFNLYQPPASGYQCNLFINGNNVGSDTTAQSQKHMGSIYVAAGTAVSITMQAVSQSTAPGQGGTLHVLAFFIPATA